MIELRKNPQRQQWMMQQKQHAPMMQQQISEGSSDSMRYRESLDFIEQRNPGQFPLNMVLEQKLPMFDPLYKKILPPQISKAMENYDITKIKTYFMA